MIEIQNILSYQFKEPRWIEMALNHKSFVNENRSGENNEKLEFIGDAVLGLILAESLYFYFPSDAEGDLSKKRASLVNEAILSEIAKELKLNHHIRLGKGELQTGGLDRPRLLASALEAIIGALFMDGGYPAAKNFVVRIFENKLKDKKIALNYEQDFKSRLQEIIQKKYKETPQYLVVAESGAPHDRTFKVQVLVQQKVLAESEGRSKKEAEQKAAQVALSLENGEA